MSDGNIVDIISKLGIDAEGVYTELDKVNAKYGQSTEIIRKQQKELAELTKFEQGLQAQRAKTNNPTIQAQFTKEIEKTQAKIKEMTKAVNDQTAALKNEKLEADKLKKGLGDAFDGTKAKSLKAQLRELKAELADTDDEEKFTELSIKAGKLEDKIGDASTAARIFASDSKFEILGNALGNVGQKLLALDFDGAVQGSQLLVKASSQITFKDALQGIRQIGTVLANLGKALLTNPLFLIGAAVGALISAWSDLTDSIKTTNEALKANAEASKKSREEIYELVRANRDLALANEIASGQLSKVNGEKLKNQNKFKDEYLKILKEQREKEKEANEEYLKQKEEDGFAGSKKLFEALGGETDLTKLHKLRLQEIEETSQKKIELIKQGFSLENSKILIDELNEENKKREDANKERLKLAQDIAKKIRDLEASNITNEFDKARAQAVIKYNDEFKLAKGNQTLILELRRQLSAEMLKIDNDEHKAESDALDKKLQENEDANNKIVSSDLEAKKKKQANSEDELNETQRHITALLAIKVQGQEDANIILLSSEINFERARLQQIAEFYGVQSDEFKKQANKLEELEAKLVGELNKIDKERVKNIIANTKQILDEVINGAQQVLSAEESKVDKLISLQQRRVDEVAKIAENGNAKLLELERERLDKLTKEKEKYVRAQQVLASIELVANTAVTVSKAAAQGGAGAAVTIAAALIALVAGLASARSIAGQAAFFKGGESEDGYTGDGNIHSESTAVGKKPYIYHRKEFIFNNEKTSKFIDVFRRVHKGELDLNQMKFESDMYRTLKAAGINTGNDTQYRSLQQPAVDLSGLRSDMRNVQDAIKGQSRLKVVIDRNGIEMIATQYTKDRKRINAIT